MFSSAEFVQEWNQIFSFKIKETDLSKPTESFVFNALINYLKMFNFDIAPMIQMKNNENITERRGFLVRFCNYIDHIYKISDKSHCFFYYDLKHPSPKKTVHMLNHLLNYLFYYNMFKESIVPFANGKIIQRQELIDKIQEYKYKHEQMAIMAKSIEEDIEKYRILAPQTLSQLDELTHAETSQKDVITELDEQLNEFNSVLESLRNEEARLSLEVVSQEEVDRLLSTKITITNAIDEQETIESTTYAKNQERFASLEKLQSIMSSIDKAMELNPPSTLQSHKNKVAEYNELETKFAQISMKKENLKIIYEKLLENLKKYENDCTSKTILLKQMKIADEKKIEDLKKLVESNEASEVDLEHELHNTETQLAEENHVTEYILESTTSLVRATMKNCGGT